MNTRLIGNKVIFLSLSMLFLSGTLFYTNKWAFLQPILLALPLLIIIVISIFKNIKIQVDYPAIVVFYIFTFLSVISALVNADTVLLVRAGILFLTFTVCSVLLPNILSKYYKPTEINSFIAKSVLYSHYPLIIIPLLINGLVLNWYNAYQGMFYNPNALGLVLVTIFAVEISLIISTLENKLIRNEKIYTKNILVKTSLLLFLFILLIFTRSRTAVLTAVLLFFSLFMLLIKKSFNKSRIKIKPFKRGIVVVVLFAVFTIFIFQATPIGELFSAQILSKFEFRSDDLTDGRGDVWIRAINEQKLFGHGRGFFEGSVTAHNTFISILAQYGSLPTIFFLIFIVQATLKGYKYATLNINDKYKFMPLSITITFLLTSMTEGMLYKLSMFVFFICYGVSSLNVKSHKISNRRRSI
ncbi:hypothetical protein GGQ84_000849 [Desulfitispora alkaliphila]|uniref:O-antigen ligase family protein n=1 Tax=Desulfitispora alkaliphila TaxID=622674 RepID=UPI003D21AE4D